MTRLFIEDDAGNVRVVPFEQNELTLGRADDNGLVLAERNVSRHHGRIRTADGRFWFSEVQARYGFRVNGERARGEVEIQPGDIVQVGDFRVKVLPRDGALVEEAVETPSRRQTVVDAPAMAAPPPAARTATVTSLKEMEVVAQMGWRSDFDAEEESGKTQVRRALLLLALLLLAGGLALAYIQLSSEEMLVPAPRPRVTEAAKPAVEPAVEAAPEPPAAEPTPVPEPEPAVRPAAVPPPKAVAAAPVEPAPRREAPRPDPAPARPREEPREPAPARAERVAAVTPPPAPAAPAPAASAGANDLLDRIDGALAEGNLGQAENLLAQCSGAGCDARLRKLADKYQAGGNSTKAIAILKRQLRTARDPVARDRIVKKIQALGGAVD